MKTRALFRLTFHENTSGQILWITLLVAVFLLVLLAAISDLAFSFRSRMLDTSSYFCIDIVMFLTATMLGSQLYAKDFSNKGLAEILIPSGVRRHTLFATRLLAQSAVLIAVTFILFFVRFSSFALAGLLEEYSFAASLHMFLFVSLKLSIAVALAAFLGAHTRPAIALLGTVALFSLGHFSSGLAGMKGIADSSEQIVSPFLHSLLMAVRVWNPNYLVLESLQGQWENPSFQELLLRLSWGVGAFFFLVACAMLSVRKRDINPLRIS